MNKVTTKAWTMLFATGSLSLLLLAEPALALTAPVLSIVAVSTSTTSTTYAINLTNDGDKFNVVEFDLRFATTTEFEIGNIKSALCLPDFVIENTHKKDIGSWYVACGTFIPFSDASTTLATFTVKHRATTPTPEFAFGTSTALYRHDGLGTQVTPTFATTTGATTTAKAAR